jgi:RNA polymerase sigma factor (sigma-70 family)
MEVSSLSHPSSIPGLRGPTALLRLQSDERLIVLTRRGQHAAFEVLCARYQSRLLSFCRHMLASREDAEDVLQEVFAAAFNAVLADERDINVRPWLYRIARNRSLNHLRRASAIGVDSMDVHYSEHGLSTGDKVMRRESFRELIADVHELPETQRTALLLREIDALSYEQIADAMETTVPSVKSLLVRARISLGEAAEARKLSCEEVRLELGEVAEGLGKLSTPARRHVRGCERCAFFRKQLKDNNHALAMIMPVGPLLLVKKLLLAKLGTTASAGGAHVAGGAGATVSATASAGAGATAAAGGGGVASGIVTAGAGALATKAVAGLAAAAIVAASAVAADHAVVHHHRPPAIASASVSSHAYEPVVVHQALQPVTAGGPAVHAGLAAAHRQHRAKSAKLALQTPTTPPVSTATTTATAPAAKPADPQPVTEVTTNTTELPASATTVPATTGTATTTTPITPPAATTPTTTAPTGETPPAPTEPAPPAPTEPPAPAPTEEPVPTPNVSETPSKPDAGGTEAPADEAAAVAHTSVEVAVAHASVHGGDRRDDRGISRDAHRWR